MTADARPVLLCVDDEPNDLAALRRSLSREPVRVLSTGDPQEALDWIGRTRISVVIADQSMPAMSGIDLLRRVRERSPATARVLITGLPDPGAVAAPGGPAVQKWLGKPWDDDQLRSTVRGLLESPPRRRFLREPVVWLDAAGKSAARLLCPVAVRIPRLGPNRRRLVLPLRRLGRLDDSPLRFLRGLQNGLERHDLEAVLLDPSGIAARLARAGAVPGGRLSVVGAGPLPGPRRRILVVSGDAAELAFLAQLARTLGFEALPAAGRDSALEALARSAADAAVLDAGLPEGGAMDLLQRLSSGGRRPPVLLAADAVPRWPYEVYERWAIRDCVTRPYRFDEVHEAARRLAEEGIPGGSAGGTGGAG